MRRAVGLLVAIGLAAIAILGLLAFGVRNVQADIDDRVNDALADAGYGDVIVDVDGRDVALLGVPAEAGDAVRKLVGDLRGVRRVKIAGSVPADEETPVDEIPTDEPTPAATAEPTEEPTPTAGAGGVEGPLANPDIAQVLAELAGQRIGFASSSSALSTDAGSQLEAIAAKLAASPDLSLVVSGSSAPAESPDLAGERAQAVIDALVASGIDPSRLSLGNARADGAVVTFVPRAGGNP